MAAPFSLLALSLILACGFVLPARADDAAPREISITTSDGVRLAGFSYGHSDRVVILSHQINHDQESWAGLAQQLVDAGFEVLTYNFRGFAPSEGVQLPEKFVLDLEAAAAFARAEGATHLALVGASAGGIATVETAAAIKPDVLVTLSAPLAYAGLEATDAALAASPAAKLFVNVAFDSYAKDTRHMGEVASEPKLLAIWPGAGHGTDMFKTKAGGDIEAQIVGFIAANMPAR